MTRSMPRSFTTLGILLVLVLLAPPASADAVADAKLKFDDGARAFSQRRYAEAATFYEEAAAREAHPVPLVNAAEAWERDGNDVRAARDYDAADAIALDETMRADIQRRLARLSRRIATVDVDGAADLRVRVDDAPAVTPRARIRLAPGTHVFELVNVSSGERRSRNETFVAGETRYLVFQWTPVETPPSPPVEGPAPAPPRSQPPVPQRRGPPLASLISVGVAGAAGATALVFGGLTLGAQSDFDARPTARNADRFEGFRTATNASVIVAGGMLLVAGGIWLFTRR